MASAIVNLSPDMHESYYGTLLTLPNLQIVASRLREGTLSIASIQPFLRDESGYVLRRLVNSCIVCPPSKPEGEALNKALSAGVRMLSDVPLRIGCIAASAVVPTC